MEGTKQYVLEKQMFAMKPTDCPDIPPCGESPRVPSHSWMIFTRLNTIFTDLTQVLTDIRNKCFCHAT